MTRELLGPDHEEIVTCLVNLAKSLDETRSEGAEELVEEGFAMARKLFGEEQNHIRLVELHTALSMIHLKSERGQQAVTSSGEALAMARELFPDGHPQLAAQLEIHSRILLAFNQLPEGEAALLEALKIRRRLFPRGHPAIVTTLKTLGRFHFQLGKFHEAALECGEALELCEEFFADDHAQIAEMLTLLAHTNSNLGQMDEAKPLAERALSMRKSLDESHIALNLNCLALSDTKQGNHLDAETKLLEALELLEREPTSTSESDFSAKNLQSVLQFSLGVSLRRQEKHAAAEIALLKTVDLKESMGERDLDAAYALEGLGSMQRILGKLEEAEDSLRKALAMGTELLGADHPDVAQSLQLLTDVLMEQGKYSEAEQLLKKALRLPRPQKDKDRLDIARMLSRLATTLTGQEKFAEAEKIQREALEMMIKLKGEKAAETFACLGNLAHILEGQEDYEAAEDILRKALKDLGEIDGPSDRNIATVLSNLARVVSKQGELVDAENLLRRSLTIQKASMGFEHPTSLTFLAISLRDQDKFKEADATFESALVGSEKMFGKGNPKIAIILFHYAESLHEQSKHSKALALAQRALSIEKKPLEPGHSNLAKSYELSGKIHSGLGNLEEAEKFREKKKRINEAIANRAGESQAEAEVEPGEASPHQANPAPAGEEGEDPTAPDEDGFVPLVPKGG